MTNRLTSLLLLCSINICAQRQLSTPEINRIADLGKVWSVLHYFHPTVANGKVVTDSLIVSTAAQLAQSPTATAFQEAVQAMFNRLGDPATRILTQHNAAPVLYTAAGKWGTRWLPNQCLYISLPPSVLVQHGFDPHELTQLLPHTQSVILDCRDYPGLAINNEEKTKHEIWAPLFKWLLGSAKLAPLMERKVFHDGFLSQTMEGGNIYNAGWKNDLLANEFTGKGAPLQLPLLIVANEHTSPLLLARFLQLKNTINCKVVVEGERQGCHLGNSVQLALSDGLEINVRVSDFYTNKTERLPAPDTVVATITDTSTGGQWQTFLQKLVISSVSQNAELDQLDLTFQYPIPGWYKDDFYPATGQRLLAFYNWYHCIHYFFPCKKLMDKPWDKLPQEIIPLMLNAKDKFEYMMAIRKMVAAINDSHGFLTNAKNITPAREAIGYWPPVQVAFIQDKLHVIDITRDSLQTMDQLKLWDEITHIDGEPVKVAIQKWRNWIASSNEVAFVRDVSRLVLNGPEYSTINLGILRQGEALIVKLMRTGRVLGSHDKVNFNDKHPVTQWLNDSIAYVNLDKLKIKQVDSMMKAFDKAAHIIFDIRNYPQGTAWSIIPKLSTTQKKAVLFEKPYITYKAINQEPDSQLVRSYFTVEPASSKKAFKGKVIALCNETTQSQAEYSIMLLQGAATHCTVVGSQTAGADGNVTQVALPGGYEAWFSGLGIKYPDGGITQRIGIKVDVVVKPTLKGLQAGIDEVLQKAMDIATGKNTSSN